MERDDWRDLGIIVIVLGTFFDAFVAPRLLIVDLVMLGAVVFIILLARRYE